MMARWVAPTALAAALCVLPLVLSTSMATEILIFGLAAAAANLLIGYGGLISFSQAAFFAVGGYATGFLLKNFDLTLWQVIPAVVVLSALLAAVVGYLSVRATGIYFIMLTFAFNQMIYYLAQQWDSVTGGEDGLSGIPRARVGIPGPYGNLDDTLVYYGVVAVLFLASILAMLRIVRSPFGAAVMAARDNARRTASIGYDVRRLQVVLFVLSGSFTGLAGCLFAMLYGIVPLDAAHWVNSGDIVFMVLVGGVGSIFGPLIGAFIYILLQDVFSLIWSRWPLLFGLFVVFVVLFLRGGVVGAVTRLTRWAQSRWAAFSASG